MAESLNERRIAIIDPVGIKAGLDHYDISLANSLRKNGWKSYVYSNFGDRKTNHFRFTFNKYLLTRVSLLTDFMRALKKSRSRKTEIVILHIFHSSKVDMIFIKLVKLYGMKICSIIHDIESFISEKDSKVAKIVQQSDFVVVHNEVSKNELIQKINKDEERKVAIIPHGNFLTLPPRSENKISYNIFTPEKGKKYILFFGMLKRSKGLAILLEAMKNVDEDIHLIVAGRKRDISFAEDEKTIIKFGLSNRIHTIIRYVTNEEREELFDISDLIILPYRKIYQSGIMLMAMSRDLPVIASDIPSNTSMIGDQHGMLFTSEDPADLGNKINLLMHDVTLRKKISDSAKEYVTLHHNWDNIAQSFINLFR